MGADAVRLDERQSAEPVTCGSCSYYRRGAGVRGECKFKMPPWIKLLHAHARWDSGPGGEMFENSGDPTMVYDHQTCSFWRPSGLSYVKDRTWTVEETP